MEWKFLYIKNNQVLPYLLLSKALLVSYYKYSRYNLILKVCVTIKPKYHYCVLSCPQHCCHLLGEAAVLRGYNWQTAAAPSLSIVLGAS